MILLQIGGNNLPPMLPPVSRLRHAPKNAKPAGNNSQVPSTDADTLNKADEEILRYIAAFH
ncbi:MAG: hypothetical protein AB7Q04_06475 [Steroidobacteraceae bacterium]